MYVWGGGYVKYVHCLYMYYMALQPIQSINTTIVFLLKNSAEITEFCLAKVLEVKLQNIYTRRLKC